MQQKSAPQIKEMFDNISKSYDTLNNIISVFLHKYVKKAALRLVPFDKNAIVLDLCTGSGDLAAIAKALYPDIEITGVDFSPKMLEIASNKHKNIKFKLENAENLTFKDETFDTITAGFGLRNVSDKCKALNEISRTLKPGGTFLHLDFGRKNFISKIYDIFALTLARLFSKNYDAYKYLINSKNDFPPPEKLAENFKRHGLLLVKRKDFFFGIISAQVFKKQTSA